MVKPGYKLTESGIIPVEWIDNQIKNVGYLTSGESPSHFDFSAGQIPYFKVEQLNNSVKYQIESPYHTYSPKTIDKGSIIFPKRGAAIATNKVRILAQPSLLDTNIMALTITNEEVNGEYLYYWIVRKGLWQIADTTSVPQINNKHILPLWFPLPSVVEQENIANALADIDDLITIFDHLIEKKKAIKQSAMQELLTGKKRLPGFSGRWVSGKWKEVLDCFSSGATPYRGNPIFYKGQIKWVSSGELNYNRIVDTLEHISPEAKEKTNLTLHPTGTFLMAITGLEAAGTRGSCAILGTPATTNQSCIAIYGTDKMSTEYLFHYYVQHGDELAFQYCQGTKQQSYTAAIVKELPIYYPEDMEEQRAIASVLTSMDAEIQALQQKLEKYRQLKQGMMQQLLTGKIRLV